MPLLELRDVRKSFRTGSGAIVDAVSGVTLSVEPGETLGLIGESGSGKSTLGRLALGLYAPDGGQVRFEDRDLNAMRREELRIARSRLSVVFQEPFEALNPRKPIAKIVGEPLEIHAPGLSAGERSRIVCATLEEVGLTTACFHRYPRELSGGEQQRVGIARAVIARPRLVILDEPTSSLDLSIRAQVLLLLSQLQHTHGLAYLFISHDLHTIEYMSGRVAVLKAGAVVEEGSSDDVFRAPAHPYTKTLLESTLSLGA